MLMRNMPRSGLVQRHDFGGIRLATESWRVLASDGATRNIYAVGSLAQGERHYVNALDSILRSVDDVVRAIV